MGIPPRVETDWETRTVTVPGTSSNLPWGAALQYWSTSQDWGVATYNTRPWRTDARVTVANLARTNGPSRNNTSGGTTDMDMTNYPGARQRQDRSYGYAGTGTQDQALGFLFAYDNFNCFTYSSHFGVGVNNWLGPVLTKPDLRYGPFDSSATGLSLPEWNTLFGDAPAGYSRELDLDACTISLTVTMGLGDQSTWHRGSPSYLRYRACQYPAVDWGVDGYLNSTQLLGSTPLVGAWSGTDTFTPLLSTQYFGGYSYFGRPISGVQDEYIVKNSYSIWVMPNATPATAQYYADNYFEQIVTPDFQVNSDPGYDETGLSWGATTDLFGGPSQNEFGQIWCSTTATLSIRQRFYKYRYFQEPPPLHQTSRLGVLDSPDQYASGRITPQSSGVQAAEL